MRANECIHIRLRTNNSSVNTGRCVHMWTYLHTYACVLVPTAADGDGCVCVEVCVHTCVNVCMHVSCVGTEGDMCGWAHAYACTYMHNYI